MKAYNSISEIRKDNRAKGRNYFDASSISFFNAKTESEVINGNFFVESIRFDHSTPKIYKLLICINGEVETVAEFDTLSGAKAVAKSLPTQYAQAWAYFTECWNNDHLQDFIDKALIEPENSRNKESVEYSTDTFCGACTYLMVKADKFNDACHKKASKMFYNQLKTIDK